MVYLSSEKDTEALTLTVVSEFDAPVERVWQLLADARQLERWWCPPGFPASFLRHDFTVPGLSVYAVPQPDGEPQYAWFRFLEIDEPRSVTFQDGFGDADGTPIGDLGVMTMTFALDAVAGGTRMTATTRFESADQLERLTALGMEVGMTAAIMQIYGILFAESAGVPAF